MDADGLLEDLNCKTFDDRNLRRGNSDGKKRLNKKEERVRHEKMCKREDQRNGVLTTKERKQAEEQMQVLEQIQAQKIQKAKQEETKQLVPHFGSKTDHPSESSIKQTKEARPVKGPAPQYMSFLRNQLSS